MQRSSSDLAPQRCLKLSFQVLKRFSITTLASYKIRREPSLGQAPLDTSFLQSFTLPRALTASYQRPAAFSLAHHSNTPLTCTHHHHSASSGVSFIPLPNVTRENTETATTEQAALPTLSRGEAMPLLRGLPLSGPTVGASFPPADHVQPSSCWVV